MFQQDHKNGKFTKVFKILRNINRFFYDFVSVFKKKKNITQRSLLVIFANVYKRTFVLWQNQRLVGNVTDVMHVEYGECAACHFSMPHAHALDDGAALHCVDMTCRLHYMKATITYIHTYIHTSFSSEFILSLVMNSSQTNGYNDANGYFIYGHD
jgi:hypothetical protein